MRGSDDAPQPREWIGGVHSSSTEPVPGCPSLLEPRRTPPSWEPW
jgi:hypothetical protein